MFQQIRANKRRSLFLTVAVAAMLLAVSYASAEYYGPGYGYYGIIAGALVWFILALTSLYAGPLIYMAMSGAKKTEKKDNPRLFNIVEEMSIAAGLPKVPDIYIIDDDMPNAFATGRSPKNSAIAVTTGLLKILNRDELQGVVAHEVGHIKNRDVSYLLLVGIMVGAITLITDVFVRGLFFRSRSRSASSVGSQFQLVIFAVAIALIVISPLVARLVHLAVSRKREYLADACSAQFTRYPEGLASALEKIEAAVKNSPQGMAHISQVTAAMYTVNPLEARRSRHGGLFSTHPATIDRIKILRSMAGPSLSDYNEAFRRTVNARSDLIGEADRSRGDVPGPNRGPLPPENISKRELARQATDTMWRAGHYDFKNCACGMIFKIPPDIAHGNISCPKCGRGILV